MSENDFQPEVSFYDARSESSLEKAARALAEDYEKHSTSNQPLDLEGIADQTGVSSSRLETWAETITRRQQAIFYGPPGTGKTFLAEKLANSIAGRRGVVDLVQFHSSFTYEDFIQGLRPKSDAGGSLTYEMKDGRFLEFCSKASEADAPCVLIIDEINRANLSQVFGELMYLLEYREETISLAGGEGFSIPQNVHIIGTMNTADRSIALVDFALRRRFAFFPLFANEEFVESVIRDYHEQSGTDFSVDGLIEQVKRINQAIEGKHHAIGPSYFLRENLGSKIESIWRYEIVPYLEEYFFEQPDRVDPFRWEQVSQQLLRDDKDTGNS